MAAGELGESVCYIFVYLQIPESLGPVMVFYHLVLVIIIVDSTPFPFFYLGMAKMRLLKPELDLIKGRRMATRHTGPAGPDEVVSAGRRKPTGRLHPLVAADAYPFLRCLFLPGIGRNETTVILWAGGFIHL